jgi:hypothetical protein
MGITENLIWMCDINARFDEHVKELYKREPFWRLCSTCPDGHCCSKVIFPVLNRKGNPFLAEDWWMMLDEETAKIWGTDSAVDALVHFAEKMNESIPADLNSGSGGNNGAD